MMKILPATLYLLLFTFNSFAQSVGINNTGTAPDASALLDLNATDKGFLITRVDTTGITSPAFGLMTLAPKDSCLYLYNGNSWIGMGGGGSDCSCNCASSSECGLPFTDSRDGKEYGTLKIGNQCWMRENLNFTPSSNSSWCYDNDPNKCNLYGRLYDWYTASNSTSSNTNPSGVQGICPAGWHLPSDEEWKELEKALDMPQAIAELSGWRGTNEGNKLKEAGTVNWHATNTGTNTSGFTALPGGYRTANLGSFFHEGTYGLWWSTTEDGTEAFRRILRNTIGMVARDKLSKGSAKSVRCIKD